MVSDVANEYGIIGLIAEICDLPVVCSTYSTVLYVCFGRTVRKDSIRI
jgi:hypothetical protein